MDRASRAAGLSDTRSFVLPYDLFHGGIPGGDDCPPAGVPGGCGHLVVGTTRVWETIHGGNAYIGSADWYVTNNPTTQNMTKQTLGNRSFINRSSTLRSFRALQWWEQTTPMSGSDSILAPALKHRPTGWMLPATTRCCLCAL